MEFPKCVRCHGKLPILSASWELPLESEQCECEESVFYEAYKDETLLKRLVWWLLNVGKLLREK